jgi:spermidine synthase
MLSLREFIESFKVKHETLNSNGVKIQVVENDKMRMFKLDGATNSVLNKHTIYTNGYWDYFIPLVYAYKNPKILMIGLGIGTTQYQLHKLFDGRMKMDIVELDKEVVRLARKYALIRTKDNVIIGDGEDYVAKTKKRYDIIILDAYGKGAKIPKQFYKERFIENASRILNNKGTLAINYAMHPYGILKFGGYRKLLSRFFRVYGVNSDKNGGMQIIVCLKDGLSKNEMLRRIKGRMNTDEENRHLLKSYLLMKEK